MSVENDAIEKTDTVSCSHTISIGSQDKLTVTVYRACPPEVNKRKCEIISSKIGLTEAASMINAWKQCLSLYKELLVPEFIISIKTAGMLGLRVVC